MRRPAVTEAQVIAVGLAGAFLVALAGGYVHPRTRPYVRKYGWLALVPLAFLAGVAFLGGRGRRVGVPEGDGGVAAGEASKQAVRALADHAMAMAADADADLADRRLEAQAKTEEAQAELVEYRQAVEEARKLEDAVARRSQLVALVESTR